MTGFPLRYKTKNRQFKEFFEKSPELCQICDLLSKLFREHVSQIDVTSENPEIRKEVDELKGDESDVKKQKYQLLQKMEEWVTMAQNVFLELIKFMLHGASVEKELAADSMTPNGTKIKQENDKMDKLLIRWLKDDNICQGHEFTLLRNWIHGVGVENSEDEEDMEMDEIDEIESEKRSDSLNRSDGQNSLEGGDRFPPNLEGVNP